MNPFSLVVCRLLPSAKRLPFSRTRPITPLSLESAGHDSISRLEKALCSAGETTNGRLNSDDGFSCREQRRRSRRLRAQGQLNCSCSTTAIVE